MSITPKLLLILLFAWNTCTAASVYAVTTNQYFGTLNLDTGAFTQIGPNLPGESSGLVTAPNGNFLSLAFSGDLLSINPRTGAANVIGATGLGDCSTEMSPCGANSAFFLVQFKGTDYAEDNANNLYKVNPTTGAATLVGSTGIPPIPFKLDSTNPDGTVNISDQTLFVSGGNLYETFDAGTIDFSNGNITPVIAPALYRIDVISGRATRIGPTGFGLFSAIDSGGTILAYSAPLQGLVSLDLATGNTTFLRDVDPSVGFVSGVAPVPEPSTMVLLSLGLIGGVLRHSRRSVTLCPK